jgi:Protein kinase domain/Pentapeptide repeats (8 copies)
MTQGNDRPRPAPPSPGPLDPRRASIPPSTRPSAEHVRALDAATQLGVRLLKKFAQRPLMSVWKGDDATSKPVLLTVVDACGTPSERDRVVHAAHALAPLSGTPTIMNVSRVSDDADAFVSDFLGAGTAADLVVLQWPLQKKLDFVCRVTDALAALHLASIVHGCLCPDNVLLDDDLHPVLTEIGMVSVRASLEGDPENFFGYGAYAAPETMEHAPDPRSDVYSVGRLLSFVVLDRAPETPAQGQASPDINELHAKSPAIATIVQKCVALPDARYGSMKELLADLRRCKQLLVPESASIPRSPDPRGPGATHVAPATLAPKPAPLALARPHKASEAAPRLVQKAEARDSTVDGAPAWVSLVSIAVLAGVIGVVLTHPVRSDILHVALQGVTIFAAIGLTTSLRVSSGMRIGLGVLALVAAVVTNPVDRLAPLDSDDALVRADTARRYVEGGGKNLHKSRLVLADLRNLDLAGADLEGADVTSASLAKSSLAGARVSGASFVGTDLSGTNLTGVDLEHAVAVETAACDEATQFPSGWYCEPSGRVKHGVPP